MDFSTAINGCLKKYNAYKEYEELNQLKEGQKKNENSQNEEQGQRGSIRCDYLVVTHSSIVDLSSEEFLSSKSTIFVFRK